MRVNGMKNRIKLEILLIICFFLTTGITVPVCAETSYEQMICINGHCSSTSMHGGSYNWPDWYRPPGPGPGPYPYYPGPYYYNPSDYYPSYYSPSYWGPYRTIRYDGYLCAGQYRVYCFRIGGERSYIEWILNSDCFGGYEPVMMSMGPDAITSAREMYCGTDFDLYVYQNRQPCTWCLADRVDLSGGSNAYVGWRYPCTGCYYCVVVYCKSGCGNYRLTCNSYTDTSWYPYYTPSMSQVMAPEMATAVDQVMYTDENTAFATTMSAGDTSSYVWANDESPGTEYPDTSGYYDDGTLVASGYGSG